MSRLYIVTLFINLYTDYIMQNTRLDEAQTGIKIGGKNINNLRYADDTTLMTDFIFLGSKITADSDCNHEI